MAKDNPEGRLTARDWQLLSPVVALLMVGTLLPIAVVASVSLMRPLAYGGVDWGRFSFDAYLNLIVDRDFDGNLIFQSDHVRIFARSLALAAATTAGCVALGVPTALFIATQPPRRKNALLILVTIPFWTSLVIRSYAWIILIADHGFANRALNGLGVLAGPLGLLYTTPATLIGLLYTFFPFMVLPVYASLDDFDWRIVEAAYDLGATQWRALRDVVIPNCMPGIAAGIGLVFVPAFGSYVIPNLLGGSHSMMIGNLIEMKFTQGRNWPLGASLSLALVGLVLAMMLARRLTSAKREVLA